MRLPQRPNQAEYFLILMGVAATLAFSVWLALLNNFVIEQAGFSGREIGILQSVREIPGFLAFTTVFVLLIIKEQSFAVVSVALLGLGVALTGFFPNTYALYFTTVLMSTGFHYFYTLQQSLTLQWIEKPQTPLVLGRLSSSASIAALIAYGFVWLGFEYWQLDFRWLYLTAGCFAILIALLAWLIFPAFPHKVPQRKHLVLRKRYWLYYALTFMSGARRQIFMVFAGFLMVEKFGYSVANIAILFLINHSLNALLAPKIGRLVAHFGERRMMLIEYTGLAIIFSAYAFVQQANIAAGLYILDHLLFAMAIAIKSYFQKIADPADIASTASVSFTINHIAAVVIPVSFGLLWLHSPKMVFLAGTAMAIVSLLLALFVPGHPAAGNEIRFTQTPASVETLQNNES